MTTGVGYGGQPRASGEEKERERGFPSQYLDKNVVNQRTFREGKGNDTLSGLLKVSPPPEESKGSCGALHKKGSEWSKTRGEWLRAFIGPASL